MLDAPEAPDTDRVYRNYLVTCAMLGIEPTPREQALGLIQESDRDNRRRPGAADDALATCASRRCSGRRAGVLRP